jgi:hypothetical protein
MGNVEPATVQEMSTDLKSPRRAVDLTGETIHDERIAKSSGAPGTNYVPVYENLVCHKARAKMIGVTS